MQPTRRKRNSPVFGFAPATARECKNCTNALIDDLPAFSGSSHFPLKSGDSAFLLSAIKMAHRLHS
jgi:hypothetical protein